MAVKILYNKIEAILKQQPQARDSDEYLQAWIWWEEAEKPHLMSFETWLRGYMNKKCTSPESIRRTRQKVQEDNPALRGTTYAARHANQKPIQGQLGYPVK